MKRTSGFSLLEVLVAGAILAAVGMAVMSAMAQGAREVGTTSDYTVALLLEQKISEETMYGLEVDTHGDGRLLEQNGGWHSVQDATMPYFAVLEDTAAPWGRLEAGTDSHIEPTNEGVYRLYRNFQLSLGCVPKQVDALPGQPELVLEFSSNLECPGFGDKTRPFSTTTLLARPVITPVGKPWVAQDTARQDAEIVEQFWPQRVKQSLNSVVAATGADLAGTRDLGQICTATEYAMLAMADIDQLIVTSTTKAATLPAGSVELVNELLTTAKLQELKGALAWKVLLFAKAPAQRLSAGINPHLLGTEASLTTTGVQIPMKSVILLNSVLKVSVAQALDSYYRARQSLPTSYSRFYRRFTLERKILELAELRVLQTGTTDVGFVTAWLDFLIEQYRGRNRWVTAYAAEERSKATGPAGIAQLQPDIDRRVSDAVAADASLHQMAASIGIH